MSDADTERFDWPEDLPSWPRDPGVPHPLDQAAEYLQALANALGVDCLVLGVRPDGRVTIAGEHKVYRLWTIEADVNPEANADGALLPSAALPKGPRLKPWRPIRRKA